MLLGSTCKAQEAPLVNTPREPAPSPTQLADALLHSNNPDNKKILEKLGLCTEDPNTDARVLFDNFDDDDEPEAIVACNDLDTSKAVVLDRKGRQWFRVAHLSAWLGYEREPLRTFIQLVDLGRWPAKDLVVRDTVAHGTGVYARELIVYRMKDSSFKEILRLPEELSSWCATDPAICNERRQTIFVPFASYPNEQAASAVVVRTYEAELGPAIELHEEELFRSESPDPEFWKDFHVAKCEGYSWNQNQFRFIPDRKVTADHCKESAPTEPKP